MIRIGGEPTSEGDGDVEFCGLIYPHGDEISKHMAARLRSEPFYQHDKLAQALAVVKRRRGAVDCGAWVGAWSRELARHFSRVLAIEANADNARCVGKNTLNMLNVSFMHAAVGDRTGHAALLDAPNAPNVGTRVVDVPTKGGVPIWRIDDMERVQNLGPIDYMKIHVNGMELKALRGAVETIKRNKPVLTIVLKAALADYGGTREDAYGLLRGLGYVPAGGTKLYQIWTPS